MQQQDFKHYRDFGRPCRDVGRISPECIPSGHGKLWVSGTCGDVCPVPAGRAALWLLRRAASPAAGRQDLLTSESLKSVALSIALSSSAKRCKCWVSASTELDSSRGREMSRAGDGEAAVIFLHPSSPLCSMTPNSSQKTLCKQGNAVCLTTGLRVCCFFPTF